jgi:pimeloyl-ACP methyl ester carboxylesterase
MIMSSIEVRRAKLASGMALEYAERGRGTPVLFLHGYSDSWRSFEQVLERLPADVRGIAVTQRGHGESDRPREYGIEHFAADGVAFLDALRLPAAVVVGHSMGSLVAQEMAVTAPARVSGLVLVGAAARFDNSLVTELLHAVGELRDPVPRAFADEFQRGTIYRPIGEAALSRFVDESMKLPARVWRDVGSSIGTYGSAERLSRLRVPTLVVRGDRDQIAAHADQSLLVEAIAGAEMLVYADIGHALHWETPQRFTNDVVRFVRSLVSSEEATAARAEASERRDR